MDLKTDLAALDAKALRRHLRLITQADKSTVHIEGQALIQFSSNNYLGLARHPQVLEAVKQVLEHWGVGATSSRLLSGSSIIHQDLESALAAYVGQEAALLFPTGYQANLGIVTALVGPGDAIVMDRLCHASLVDGARLSGARLFVYEHGNVEAAESALSRAASYPRRLFITESLFSMDGDFAPLAALLPLARRYDAISLVDEAHALGVWEITKGADVTVGTLSKALGSQGGFVAGSKDLMDLVLNKARSFIYTTGLSPACVAAAFAALSLVQEDGAARARVKSLAKSLREGLQAQGWNTLSSESQIVPVLLGSAERALALAAQLKEAGFYVPAIRPPTVHEGQCRLRFSVTADHSPADIEKLLEAMKVFPRD